ncbi:hypothetical protein [Roseisolibacter agri]|uniref:BIG2 domain-containing protein n=1 Tax=Roseisolibacter agri TaxID=2014610 RepID=A0AA37QF34_9BACT|nr:hypothetical protein [Roseisolibacter agri]GLC25623.1 hypothetical protein rosag_21360 [Roseisolibacter agri]
MSAPTLALLALLQQPAAGQPPAPAAPSPVARIEVSPADPVVAAMDTLRLSARAFDAQGKVMENVHLRFVPTGGWFEGTVDTTGLVKSGATGILPVGVVAMVPGSRPFVERVSVRMVPGAAARVAVEGLPSTLVVGQRVALQATAYSAQNDRREDAVRWSSSMPGAVAVRDGFVVALAPGRAVLTAEAGRARTTVPVTVVAARVASLQVTAGAAPSAGWRTGDVIRFSAVAKDAQGKVIPGVAATWSFSPGQGMIDPDGAFVGYEARPYTITASLGDRSATTIVTLAPRDVRRPASVVGRLPRTRFTTEEVWLHPTEKVAYLGSGSGGDVMYAIDISNPAAPVVTDSLVSNTRRVNDVMTTADGRYLVFTREGASDRRNGVVVASLEDPRHPKVLSEYTATVTAGVHSAFVYTQPKFGTHVYLTNDGTGAFHILDLNDPKSPKEVAVWKTPRPEFAGDAGRSLHDVDVQDGLAYLSYWNDGLVILDVGNGIKGGSPSNPVLVSQYKYDLNDLYRQVEAAGGPGFIRGTHTAWRHRNYVFIADEVFPASGLQGAPANSASAGRAYGRLQVIDISDLTKPKSVAFYEPENGGVHNIWIAGDTLYMGAYNAGFRTFDISGELRGDLRAQAREMAHVHTADPQGKVINTPMTWGVVVRDGLAYVNDMYNGLWIVRMEPSKAPKPKVMQ